MRIAIVGTGIAGNAAAWLLSRHHAVTVYEKDERPGGHAHTVDISYEGERIAVDTGFIVFNTLNYPHLTGLFRHLGIETVESNMSFAVSADGGRFEWAGQQGSLGRILNAVFAQRSNIVRPRFLTMLKDMTRFNRDAGADLKAGRLDGITLGQYLAREGYGEALTTDYLVPMGAAIWSTPVDQMMAFPARNFVAFFENHRLMHWDRPVWRTVRGGSRSYVQRLIADMDDTVRLGTGVSRIVRDAHGVAITDVHGRTERFDQVVIGAHSDEALAMLADASPDETSVLGAVRYRPNDVYLHRDVRLMPKRRAAWSAWNFLRTATTGVSGTEVCVSYWMNALQGIDADKPLFVTLNPPFAPDPALTFRRFSYAHPQYDAAAFAAQDRLAAIQGVQRTWFCGAWTGYGFHEDGLRSAVDVAARLGAAIPWMDSSQDLAPVAEAAE